MGLGRLHNDQIPISDQDILEHLYNDSIDYLKGKPLKLNLKKFPFVFSRGYDRDSPIKMKDVLQKMIAQHGKIAFVKEKTVPKKKVIAEAEDGMVVLPNTNNILDKLEKVIHEAQNSDFKGQNGRNSWHCATNKISNSISSKNEKSEKKKSTYIGCAELGYCAYATDEYINCAYATEYIKSDLKSNEYKPVCLKFYVPKICSLKGEMEKKVTWKGLPYGTHVTLFDPNKMSWIDPLYNLKFHNSKEYIEFLIPKIEWVEEKDKPICFAIQPLSSINFDDGKMIASNWDPIIPSMHFIYKNKECFEGEKAEDELNAEYAKCKANMNAYVQSSKTL